MDTKTSNWQHQLTGQLPYLGHRNWILVADKAFPLQSSPGVNYIDTSDSIQHVLAKTLDILKTAPHITPIIYQDLELNYLDDSFSAGIETLKQDFATILQNTAIQSILHEQVFEKMDTASKLFNILVLKTECTIPYTSVFIELDCGYWSAEKENRLREAIKSAK